MLEIEYSTAEYSEARQAHFESETPSTRLLVPALGFVGIVVCLFKSITLWHRVKTHSTVPYDDVSGVADLYAPCIFAMLLAIRPKKAGKKIRRAIIKITITNRQRLLERISLSLGFGMAIAVVIIQIEIQTIQSKQFASENILPLLLVLFWGVLFFVGRKKLKVPAQLAVPWRFRFDTNEFSMTSDLQFVSVKWGLFIRCVESQELFTLYPNSKYFYIVPKRAFESGQEVVDFRYQLQKWVHGQSSGFPVVQPVPVETIEE